MKNIIKKMWSKQRVVILLLAFAVFATRANTVGSGFFVTHIETKYIFPRNTNNLISDLVVLNEGFVLEDIQTTCSFNALFPIDSDVTLNGGTLYLLRDLNFGSFNNFTSVGTVVGNYHAVRFPNSVLPIELPSDDDKVLEVIDTFTDANIISSVDWAYDDNYVISGLEAVSNNIRIFSFDGSSLTQKKLLSLDTKIYQVRWHPSDYFFAVGTERATYELKVYYFNTQTNEVLLTYNGAIGNAVHALAWSQDAAFLAVGSKALNSELQVYAFSGGALVLKDSVNLENPVSRDAIAWDASGNYVAVGAANKIFIYAFNGETLSLHASLDLLRIIADDVDGDGIHSFGGDVIEEVRSLDWSPTGSFLAVGLSGGFHRIRLYEHNAIAGTITEVYRERNDNEKREYNKLFYLLQENNKTFYSLHWRSDGNSVLAGRGVGEKSEFRIYQFDGIQKTLKFVNGREILADVRAVRWAHSGNYLLGGDKLGNIIVFTMLSKPLVFKDVKLIFNSDITITADVLFQGTCVIEGGGNDITLDSSGKLGVDADSQLTIKNATLNGISAQKMYSKAASGTITLQNVTWIQDGDFAFTQGALQFKNNVEMTGDYIFAYQTVQTSTVLSRSRLILDAGFTFSYDPNTDKQNLLHFIDNSSQLILEGATLHATMTGMQLTKGKIVIKRDSFLSSEKDTINFVVIDNGIIFGDGTSGNDLACEILSGAGLHVTQGSLRYNNVNASSWSMIGDRSVLRINALTTLYLLENLNLGDGTLQLSGQAEMIPAAGKALIGDIFVVQ